MDFLYPYPSISGNLFSPKPCPGFGKKNDPFIRVRLGKFEIVKKIRVNQFCRFKGFGPHRQCCIYRPEKKRKKRKREG